MAEKSNIAADLAYMASHLELYTKVEMAAMLLAASVVIDDLMTLVGRPKIKLEDAEPEGHA
jgi:hypothetical protein